MLERVLQLIGFGLCHQLPERSFFGGGVQVPVCARDVGIYVGFIVSALVIGSFGGRRASEPPRTSVLVLAGAFFGVMVLDGVTSYAGLRTTSNDLRLATGLLAGFSLPVLIVPMINGQMWRGGPGRRVLDDGPSLAAWMLSVPLAFVALRFGAPFLGVGYPVFAAVAILATFVVVNLALVSILSPFERRAERWRHFALPVAISLVLTAAELAGAAALKAGLLGLLAE